MYGKVRISAFALAILFLNSLNFNTCTASSLVQMQLRDIERVSLFLDLDSDLRFDKTKLQSKISELLGKAGIKVEEDAPQSLRVEVRTDRSEACGGFAALYVSVRFEDEVSLKRDPTLKMTNFPTPTWQKEFLRIVAASQVQHSAEDKILYAVDLFAEQAENATRIARKAQTSNTLPRP